MEGTLSSAPLAGQPGELGEPLDFHPPRALDRVPITGRYVTLAPVDPARDAGRLFDVSRSPEIWRYMSDGPYRDAAELRASLERNAISEDPFFYTVLRDGDPQGIVSYLRITPDHGVIEIGNIWFGEPLQRTTAATEVVYLLVRHALDELGYRRLEWKCNALNRPSRRAAERFGFVFEGVFEQHMVVKGRNRDTAWYAITDRRWPPLRDAFEAWLDPANFDDQGRQLRRLEELRA